LHAIATVPEDFAVNMIQDDARLLRLPQQFSKCYEAGTCLSLLPFPLAKSVRTENLVYSLSGEDLALGQRIGIRNRVATQGLVRITYGEGCLMLQEPLDIESVK
jgi:thiamine pyrophosphokinase